MLKKRSETKPSLEQFRRQGRIPYGSRDPVKVAGALRLLILNDEGKPQVLDWVSPECPDPAPSASETVVIAPDKG